MNISMPINIKIIPPIISACFENLLPIFLPKNRPNKQKIKVTTPIIKEEIRAPYLGFNYPKFRMKTIFLLFNNL